MRTIDTETGEVIEAGNGRSVILHDERFEFKPTGLVVSGEPDYDTWEHIGQQLQYVQGAVHWWIGDWLNYGEARWGKMYSQALDEAGFRYQTLANDKWQARQIEFSRRRENLSFSHHSEVAKFDKETQDHWLDIAERDNLTRNELREQIKASRRQPTPQPHPEIEETIAKRSPILIVSSADSIDQLEDEAVDLIITSPPYNLGDDSWPMGGNGRLPRENGIGYSDAIPEWEYQDWQMAVFNELYRTAKWGASFFYNHKVRIKNGEVIHPMHWLSRDDNPWIVRQEIIWDRTSTHNHSASLFWPEDERIYWMTKGKPTLPDRPIGKSTVWREFGPRPNSWHPAPFTEELPKMIFEAIGRDGITVLDPFAGSCTVVKVALDYGYEAIGVDISPEYLQQAINENGWTNTNVTFKAQPSETPLSVGTKA